MAVSGTMRKGLQSWIWSIEGLFPPPPGSATGSEPLSKILTSMAVIGKNGSGVEWSGGTKKSSGSGDRYSYSSATPSNANSSSTSCLTSAPPPPPPLSTRCRSQVLSSCLQGRLARWCCRSCRSCLSCSSASAAL